MPFESNLGSILQTVGYFLRFRKKGRMRCLDMKADCVWAQLCSHALLHLQGQSFIVVAEEIHALDIVPGLVLYAFGEHGRRLVFQCRNGLLLSLCFDIMVEDDLGCFRVDMIFLVARGSAGVVHLMV